MKQVVEVNFLKNRKRRVIAVSGPVILTGLLLLFNIFSGPQALLDFLHPQTAFAAAVSWDGEAGDGIWESATNWSGDAVPTADDDVLIDVTTTVSVNAATTVNSLTLGNAGGTTSPVLNFAYDANGASNNLDIDDGDLTVHTGASITHSAGTSAVVGRVDIDVQTGSATVTGSINVANKGYSDSEGPGAGTDSSGGCGGASHGGVGGTGQDDRDGLPGEVYGSITEPVMLGSGGGFCFTSSGHGGGSIKLAVAGTLTVTGSVNANGETTTSSQSGGGAGGSIWIDAGTVAGAGTITANGGQGHTTGHAGAGGGGRVAVYYDTLSMTNTNIRSFGGPGVNIAAIAGAGTVFLKDNAVGNGDLIIDNNDVQGGYGSNDDRFIGRTKLTPAATALSLTLDDLIIRNDGNLDLTADTTLAYSTLTWNDDGVITDSGGTLPAIAAGADVSIPSGAKLYANTARTWNSLTLDGTITHSNGHLTADGNAYGIDLTFTTDATINASGTISVSERGYSEFNGPGAGSVLSAGPGGGSFGGVGSKGALAGTGAPGEVYGSLSEPADLGSGGGTQSSVLATTAASGGGRVKLTVTGTLTVDGSIVANGEASGSGNIAGGSGGSIWIDAGTVAGSSTIRANGGAGGTGVGGSGGGGRVAIYYDTLSLANTNIRAYGGQNASVSERTGGAGTVYLKDNLVANPDLIIDNNDLEEIDSGARHDRYLGRTKLTPTSSAFSLTVDDLIIRNDGNLDLTADTTLAYSTLTWNDDGVITDSGGTMPIIDTGEDVTIPAGATVYANTAKTWNSLTVDGVLTHSSNFLESAGQVYDMDITSSTDITVSATGTISAVGRGYDTNEGPGAGGTGNPFAGGGSHGGTGGTGLVGAAGEVYGSISAPVTIGSGGGWNSTNISFPATSGGGAIKLTASSGTVTANGPITANASTASNFAGSAGGSVYIIANTVAGSSTVTANGAAALNSAAGSGGGGRVAVYYDTLSLANTNIRAYGGQNGSGLDLLGGAGTVYLKDNAVVNPDLIIDNSDQVLSNSDDRFAGRTKLTPSSVALSLTLDDLIVRNAGNLDLTSDTTLAYTTLSWSDGTVTDNGGTAGTGITSGAVVVATGGIWVANTARSVTSVTLDGEMRHSQNSTVETYTIDVTTSGNFSVNSGASVNLVGLGYTGGSGTGAGEDSGVYGSGAGHGGAGGVSTDGGSVAGTAYDSDVAPVNIGSGGGNSVGTGGSGGGAVLLTVGGDFLLDGSITANARTNAGTRSGGGSGGAVWLVITGAFSGGGNITANGGDASEANAGAGAGGRIRYECGSGTWSGSGTVTPGTVGGVASAGTESTDCILSAGNTAPAVTNLTAVQVTDGSGYVTIQFDADDANDDDTVEALIEYDVGAGFTKATISTVDLDTTADFGDPDVNNADAYQIGEASAYIFTSSGANTINTVWLAGTDEAGVDVAGAQIRVTLFDGTDAGTPVSSSTFNLDTEAPTVASASYKDINTDGTVDRVDVVFNETIVLGSYDASDWSFPEVGSVNLADTNAGDSGDTVQIVVTADTGETGGITAPTVLYTNNGDRITDSAGNVAATFGAAQTVTDAAAPILLSHTPAAGASGVAVDADVVLTFSETMSTATLVYTISVPPTGLSEAWTVSDTVVTISHTGDFSPGSHQVEVTAADASSGSIVAFGGAVAPATNPFSFTVANSTPTVDNLTAAQVTDGSGYVAISFDADDANDDDTLEALIEYDVGSGYTKATISTVDLDTTADFGDPDINNADAYQVGEGTGYILTSSGANTVNTIWLAGTDEPGVDVAGARVRVTLFDGSDAATPVASSMFQLDLVAPTVSSASYLDTDADGTVDRVDVVFDDTMAIGSYDASDWSFPEVGSVNLADTGASSSTNTIRVAVSADAGETGGATAPTVLYTNNGNRVTDSSGNPAATFGSAVSVTDAAAPLIISHTPANGASGVAVDADIVVNFTEAISTGTLAYTFSNAPTGVSAAWTNGDMTVTLSHTGDFASGAHTFEVTTATAAAGVATTLGGAVAPAANPFSFTVIATNNAPVATSVTAAQVTDGSGYVSISFDADDANDDDTVEALIEYDIGAGYTKATISTVDLDTTADFGDPDVNNADTYPVGEAGGYILTSSGANTVNIAWLAGTDEPTADVADAQIRVTLFDGTDTGTPVESSAFDLDVVAPTVVSASYLDTNVNGTVDRVYVAFSETISINFEAADWSFPEVGSITVNDTSGGVVGDTVRIAVTADANETGGAVDPTVLYTNNANRLTDAAGNPAATFGSAVTVTDAAAPFILSHTPADSASEVAADADVAVTFSEVMATGTLTYTISDPPTGQSVAWSNGDTIATISHTGDFTPGSHTVEVTAADAVTGGSVALAGAVAPAVNPFTFSVSNTAPTITNLTAAQVTDGSGYVSISFDADDANDDDTVEALIEYDVGAGFTKATISTVDLDTTADFGDPDINNADAYQVGEGTGYILTSSGANTVNIVWLAGTDEAGVDVSNAQIRVTLFDGTDIGTPTASSAFNLDLVAPTVTTAVYLDIDGNGAVDRVDVSFDETVSITHDTSDWTFPEVGSVNIGNDSAAITLTTVVRLTVSADADETGGAVDPTVLYTNNADRLTDTSGNPAATFGSAVTVTDAAAPLILSHTPVDSATDVALDADMVVTFTEAMDTGSLTYTISDPPSGLSTAWTVGNTVATISHTGDFSPGSHEVEVTAADAASGAPVAFEGAIAPAANPFTFTVNGAPTITNLTAAQVTDGSGYVSISFDADDANDDDTVEALIEYDVGAGFTKATISTVDLDTTADFGDPDINNADAYQVGEGTGYILTSSGANTVNIVWLAGTDEAGVDVADAAVRVTLFDGANAGTPTSSATFDLDLVAPTLSSASYLDVNGDGTVDRADVVFNETLVLDVYDASDWSFPTPGSVNLADTGASISANTVQVAVSADADETGGAVDPTVLYTNNGDRLTDTAGNPVVTFGGAQTVTDAAAPYILSHTPASGTTGVDPSADVVVNFTEAINTGTLAYTFSNAPTGISAAWTNGNTTATLSHTGDFSAGDQTFEVTTADAATGGSVTLAGALAPAENPFTFTVNTVPTITNLTASQVTDGTGYVAISFDADDADNDDTVEALIEYDVGAGFTKATISTVDGDTTADFGDPDVNNADTYPVGEAGGYILTSSGANTVNAVWLAGTDEPGIDVADAQIRVMLFDGTGTSSVATSSDFVLDLVAPTASTASYLDTNADGTVDRVDIAFDDVMTISAYDASDWSFPTPGSMTLDDTGASVSTSTVRIVVSADAGETGGATAPTVLYANNGGRLTDSSGNPVATFGAAISVSDAAAPRILSHTPTNGVTSVAVLADVVVNFTEAMNTGTVTYSFSDEPTGVSDAWSNDDTTLTVSHTGEFASGTHTFEVTAADAATGTPDALAGAISPAANPFGFTVGAGSGGGGGGGSIAIPILNNALVFENDVACSTTNLINAFLSATNAESVIVSQDPYFIGAEWEGFVADPQLTTFDAEGNRIDTMVKRWVFAGAGENPLYARFRSRTQNVSSLVSDVVVIDPTGACDGGDEEEEEQVPYIGEYVRVEGLPWVYFIGNDLVRHPVLNLLTFFTHERSISAIREVAESVLSTFRIGKPHVPKPERVLMKFASSPKVYTVYENPIDPYMPTLRWIPNEAEAERMIGDDWQDFIFELEDTFFPRFQIGTDMGAQEQVDTSDFIKVRDLIDQGTIEE